jgi:hypothetical protein
MLGLPERKSLISWVPYYPEKCYFQESISVSLRYSNPYIIFFRSVAPMMKPLISYSGLAATLLIGTVQWLGFPLAISAQYPPLNIPKVTPPASGMPQPSDMVAPGDSLPNANDALQQSNVDDVLRDPTQLTIWVCNSGDKMVAVEVKDISFWNQLTQESKVWQCAQKLPDIPGKKQTFSCEPTETMGLISVYWLKGDGGQDQMKSWMTALTNKYNMVCTTSETNKYWE